jgi:hypothetical protein
MDLTGRMDRMRAGARQRMSQLRADRVDEENRDLKAQNRLLREELSEARTERRRVLDLLEKAQLTVQGPSKRRFRLFRLLAAAGIIYSLGTRTGAFSRGRDWFEKIRARVDEMSMQSKQKMSNATYRVGDAVEHAGRSMQQAGDRIEGTGDSIERGAKGI